MLVIIYIKVLNMMCNFFNVFEEKNAINTLWIIFSLVFLVIQYIWT